MYVWRRRPRNYYAKSPTTYTSRSLCATRIYVGRSSAARRSKPWRRTMDAKGPTKYPLTLTVPRTLGLSMTSVSHTMVHSTMVHTMVHSTMYICTVGRTHDPSGKPSWTRTTHVLCTYRVGAATPHAKACLSLAIKGCLSGWNLVPIPSQAMVSPS